MDQKGLVADELVGTEHPTQACSWLTVLTGIGIKVHVVVVRFVVWYLPLTEAKLVSCLYLQISREALLGRVIFINLS